MSNDRSLYWSDLLSAHLRTIGFLVSSCVVLNLVAVLLSATRQYEQTQSTLKSDAQRAQSAQESAQVADHIESERAVWIPQPLMVPKISRDTLTSEKWSREQFELAEAGLKLSVTLPPSWDRLQVEGQVRFQPPQRREGAHTTSSRRGEYVRYTSECFGSCESLEENIAESMTRRLRRDYRAGLDPRVVHWRVHHQTWTDFSLLYHQPGEGAWLVGVSTRWSTQWLYPVRCEYRAPVKLSSADQESLQEVWIQWAPRFAKLCRGYQVTSWD